MKQIDLSCKIVAPAVAGVFVAWFDGSGSASGEMSSDHRYDLRGAALLVGGLNSLALIIEYVCMAEVYDCIPLLAHTTSSATVDHLADAALPQSADGVLIQPGHKVPGNEAEGKKKKRRPN